MTWGIIVTISIKKDLKLVIRSDLVRFAELFFESQMRGMTSIEAEEMRKIIFERALEMKKAIAYVRAQESKS